MKNILNYQEGELKMRNFDEWLNSFRESIANYKYYTDFSVVFKNADRYKVELNILNSLIGSKDIENEFNKLIKEYPQCLQAIPILLAKRESDIFCMDKEGSFTYNFKKQNVPIEQYGYFMKETGLFDLLQNHIISNLYDYVLGVNTGLDSNGRKNRGGHLMENLCEEYIKELGLPYKKEECLRDVELNAKLDLSAISNDGSVDKRFDFVVYGKQSVYAIECNFYTSSGSKLNETARSYKTIALESKEIEGFTFIWLTDGLGWKKAKNNLKETFDVLDTIYNINDMEQGILKQVII